MTFQKFSSRSTGMMIRKGILFNYLIFFIIDTFGQLDHGVYEVLE